MTAFAGQKATFDAAAELYDQARPSYPEALADAVVNLAELQPDSHLLEIGCGTGQATQLFARRGYTLLCLEPGENLAALAAHNLRAYPRVTIQPTTFEAWPLQAAAFDLVFAAQSFHWIPAEIGFSKAAAALKSTGSLALFWNVPPEGGPEASEEFQAVYRQHAPAMVHNSYKNRPFAARLQEIETEIQQSGLFRNLVVETFPWSEVLMTAEYLMLLRTFSDHLLLPEETLTRLLAGIAEVIDRQGGTIEKRYVAVLYVAQKA
jgi:SAM-dependent methyltransferase